MLRKKLDQYAGYVFLIPWLLGFFLLNLIPMLTSLYYSLCNFNLLQSPVFTGFYNYVYMFTTDFHFKNAVRVTLTYVIFSVPLQLFFSLLLALILDKGLPALRFIRASFYIPSLLGASAAISILWRQIFGADGMLNLILGAIGFESLAGTSWIADPKFAIWTLIILRIWQFGSPMIIFLAGIKQIPQSVLEAADIDGASNFQRIVRVVLPMLSPIILFNLVMQIISAFKAFTSAYIISGGTGGIMDSLLFYTIHIYNEGFNKFRMGYASALAWIFLLIVAIFTAAAFKLSDKHVYYN